MRSIKSISAVLFGLVMMVAIASGDVVAQNALPSWNDGPAKKAILEFVAAVTKKGGKDYVEPADRIATFDNDGTLWVEYPTYTPVLFAFDQIKRLAPQHPEWKTEQPFKALLEGDMKAVGASGKEGLLKLVMAAYTGMTVDDFNKTALDWLSTQKTKKFDRLYAESTYQPQLELLDYLRANGFKTFIASAGPIDFMRPTSQKLYGIPPEQVLGSRFVVKYMMKDGKKQLVRMPKIDLINDGAGKPVGIYQHIGKRPILAFGNSDNDMEMIEYTLAGKGRRLGLFVHHTDDVREYAYDRKSHAGKLDEALDRASDRWIIVDMKTEWNRIFPPK